MDIYDFAFDLGYKTAKRRFTMEMDEIIMIIIIKLCGGDPNVVFR